MLCFVNKSSILKLQKMAFTNSFQNCTILQQQSSICTVEFEGKYSNWFLFAFEFGDHKPRTLLMTSYQVIQVNNIKEYGSY